FFRDVRDQGLNQALAMRRMWNEMRMNPTDFSDVSGYTYTYLMNGTAPAGNWTGLFKPGEKIRLRFINGSSMSIFDVRIPGLKMTVVSADGQDVEPLEDRAYTLFAQSIDRSGYARGTLAPRPGMEAEVPRLDPVRWLAMQDMMGTMAMGGSGHGGMHAMDHGGMSGMDAGGMAMGGAPLVRHARTEYHNPG